MSGKRPFGMAAGLRPVDESTRLDLQRQIEDFIAGPEIGKELYQSVCGCALADIAFCVDAHALLTHAVTCRAGISSVAFKSRQSNCSYTLQEVWNEIKKLWVRESGLPAFVSQQNSTNLAFRSDGAVALLLDHLK